MHKSQQQRTNILPTQILWQCTQVMQYLHERNIIHRDIMPENILLVVSRITKKYTIKISDCGLCQQLPLGKRSNPGQTSQTVSYGWQAPEVLHLSTGANAMCIVKKNTGRKALHDNRENHLFADTTMSCVPKIDNIHQISDANVNMQMYARFRNEQDTLARCLRKLPMLTANWERFYLSLNLDKSHRGATRHVCIVSEPTSSNKNNFAVVDI
ncbi:Serine/threonine-protein kinase/endoribonuclease IRE2 [Orchesella cincta]|uniref:Serine/threonine-protein kinase/endoribonuclease IRE2 n=1 Tax=Orchesella cincta TaxID=48709 RepID=A0A1D2MSM2_ORCCI|nr:Serine/threonine-protein kinase/endoribonuclease IRE2 [Orchesella cincta]